MGAKIKIDLDVKGAMASADVLEARLRKISAAAADIFRKSNPRMQADLLKAYGINTGGGSHILQPESLLAQAARSMQKMGQLGGAGHYLAPDTLLTAGARRAAGMGPLTGLGPPRIPSGMLSDRAIEAGVKRALAMGPLNPSGINWKMAGLGALAAPMSPWVASRIMNQSGIGAHVTKMMGGSSSGLAAALFGPGGVVGFAEMFVALSYATRLVKRAFDELVGAIHRGRDLYLHSAMLGTNPQRLGHIRNAFQMVGLSPESAEAMLARGQFNKGTRMSPAAMQGAILGAGSGGVLSREEMQAIMNMSRTMASAWNMTLSTARQSAAVATNLFRVNFLTQQFSQEWHTFWDQFVEQFSGTIDALLMSATGLIHGLNALMEAMREFPAMSDLIPGLGQVAKLFRLINQAASLILPLDDPNKFHRVGVGSPMGRPESSWERMGLVLHGGLGGADFAKQTAENTKVIADYFRKRGGDFNPADFAHPNIPRGQAISWNLP